MTFGCDFWLELVIGIGDWDLRSELGIRIWEWDCGVDFGMGEGLSVTFGWNWVLGWG